MKRRVIACAVACAMALAWLYGTDVTLRAAGARLIHVAELADRSLGAWHNALFPFAIDQIVDDRGVRFGSLGSDIFHDPDDSYNEFWAVTDRGPNGNPGRRTFIVPAFDPEILHVRVKGSAIEVQSAMPILDAAGRPVTGLSNVDTFDARWPPPRTIVSARCCRSS